MTPPALAWVKAFTESINRAMLGDLESWRVQASADPLMWVVRLRVKRNFRPEEITSIRALLTGWADTNDASYRRSEWKGRDFSAMVHLRGLRPEKDKNPYEKQSDVDRRRR